MTCRRVWCFCLPTLNLRIPHYTSLFPGSDKALLLQIATHPYQCTEVPGAPSWNPSIPTYTRSRRESSAWSTAQQYCWMDHYRDRIEIPRNVFARIFFHVDRNEDKHLQDRRPARTRKEEYIGTPAQGDRSDQAGIAGPTRDWGRRERDMSRLHGIVVVHHLHVRPARTQQLNGRSDRRLMGRVRLVVHIQFFFGPRGAPPSAPCPRATPHVFARPLSTTPSPRCVFSRV